MGSVLPSGAMMTSEQEAAVYRLLRVPGMGGGAVGRVLTAWRAEPAVPETFWGRKAAEYRARWGISRRAAEFLESDSDEQRILAEAEAAAARAAEIELLSLLDGEYAALAAERELPPVLFSRGNQGLLWNAGVAVVHSRDAPEAALAWSAELARWVAEAGLMLITGHNRDAYRRTAAAAKRAAAPLVIVLDRALHGSGRPEAEPVVTARLWDEQFRAERELVVSPLWPRAGWTPAHARLRDGLIIGAAAVVVAGAVRPGGIIEGLCGRALGAERLVFRSPFCGGSMDAPLLPAESRDAAALVIEGVRRCVQREAARQGSTPGPVTGWMERRWQAEVGAFIAALTSAAKGPVWVERRPAGPLPVAGAAGDQSGGNVAAVVLIPAGAGSEAAEMLVIRRPECHSPPRDSETQALLLNPGEPITDLSMLRAYLARCRARLQAPPQK